MFRECFWPQPWRHHGAILVDTASSVHCQIVAEFHNHRSQSLWTLQPGPHSSHICSVDIGLASQIEMMIRKYVGSVGDGFLRRCPTAACKKFSWPQQIPPYFEDRALRRGELFKTFVLRIYCLLLLRLSSISKHSATDWPNGPMARRLTTIQPGVEPGSDLHQEIPGTTPG